MKEAQRCYAEMLHFLGVGAILDDFGETARRATELLAYWCGGPLQPDPIKPLPVTAASQQDWVSIKNLPFYAICEHHFVPFLGTVSIAYLPEDAIAGFGAFAHLVKQASRHPQLQEKLAATIADTIESSLKPQAVLVRIKARQMCLEMSEEHGSPVECVCDATRGKCSNSSIYKDAVATLSD